MRPVVLTTAVAIGLVIGCTGPVGQTSDDPVSSRPPATGSKPGHLPFPFTADQIRDEWVEGLEIRIRRWTPAAEAFETWTVVGADDEGVEIESIVYGADGEAAGPPTVQRSTWTQLRDHAAFPAENATREAARRATPLGDHEGWLYTVIDPTTGAVNEFFFAESMPGAPLFVHVFRDSELVEIFEQIERRRPVVE